MKDAMVITFKATTYWVVTLFSVMSNQRGDEAKRRRILSVLEELEPDEETRERINWHESFEGDQTTIGVGKEFLHEPMDVKISRNNWPVFYQAVTNWPHWLTNRPTARFLIEIDEANTRQYESKPPADKTG